MDNMWYVLLGAFIFMLGGFFGMLITALGVAASREMPKPPRKNMFDCTCGNPMIPGVHSTTNRCYTNYEEKDVKADGGPQDICGCGDPFKAGVIHSTNGPCWVKPNDPPPAKI